MEDDERPRLDLDRVRFVERRPRQRIEAFEPRRAPFDDETLAQRAAMAAPLHPEAPVRPIGVLEREPQRRHGDRIGREVLAS